MMWIGRSCFAATCALACLLIGPGRAGAWGALAIGTTADNAETASSFSVGHATEDDARETALRACRAAPRADKARSLCAVVGTFQNQCVAVVGPGWAIAPNQQRARDEAVAKCRATSSGACSSPVNSNCEGTAK